MREAGRLAVPEPAVGGLADSVYDTAERNPALVQFSLRDGAGWQSVTAARFRDQVLALAKGLLVRGVRYGDRVALMSTTRYEWTLFDYALWSIGAIPVPVYPTSSAEQVRWILAETQAVAVVVEHEDHAMTLGAICDALPSLTGIWQLDRGCVAAVSEDGQGVPDSLVHRQRLGVTPDSVATVIYTSGTGGRPKGCLLTHANFAAQSDALLAGWGEVVREGGGQAATLAFLPFAHVFGRILQVAAVRGGIRLGHHGEVSGDSLLPAITSFRPTFLQVVPYVLEKVHQRARQAAEEAGRGEVFAQAVAVAVEWATAREQRALGRGAGPGAALRLRHAAYDKLVYARLREVLGGRVRSVLCGGAPLGRELSLFFAGAGLAVHEGYGLTETCAAVTCNPPGKVKHGTVGTPLPGVSVVIAEDGEIWVRGSTVFSGYLGQAQDSTDWYDGWFGTGDLGAIDEDGYLTVTGRRKELIVTSSGKNLAPAALEERVRAHPLISQCLVVGDGRPYVGALITLDQDALAHWLKTHGREQLEPWQVLADGELHAEIQRAVAAANTAVSRAESIRAFRLLPREFGLDQGLLTPSLKLRRGAILEYYADDVAELYTP
ncbi:AMP-dependent synthetase/ligase [Kitasatospora sp. NPDC002227]|uniref:AMP-dependent synthetase/ligase n=1 Tax=Kitasatospora sp. NPDC002227 TaxID=3154773 RepID=UPI003332E8F7